MFSLNNNLHMSAGGLNEIYTASGNLRFQSNAGNNNHTIFNAGTSGFVGIGTFSPQYKLDVNGTVNVTGPLHVFRIVPQAGDSIIRFGDSTIYMNPITGNIANTNLTGFRGLGIGTSSYGFGLHTVAVGYKVRANAAGSIAIGSSETAGIMANNTPASLMIGFNSNIPTFFVGPANGNGTVGRVGIGTSSPQSDLQIGNSFSKISMGSAPGVGSTFSFSYIGFNISRASGNNWITSDDGANNGAVVLLNDAGGGLRIIGIQSRQTDNTPLTDQQIQSGTRLHVRGDGRVIIGNKTQTGGALDAPNTLLTVNGTVACQKLHVTMDNWADSIFAPNYTLMSLDSVGRFIKSEGHLPGVPSAQEMSSRGSDLVQMDVILLANIEELTLYMLVLQRENEELKARIQKLEEK